MIEMINAYKSLKGNVAYEITAYKGSKNEARS
jgi:hypothetical protein